MRYFNLSLRLQIALAHGNDKPMRERAGPLPEVVVQRFWFTKEKR